MILSSDGINWTWYLDVTITSEDTLTINRHDRLHKYDHDNHPDSMGGYSIIESSPIFVGPYKSESAAIELHRIAKYVDIWKDGQTIRYRVDNPKYVFGYGSFR